MQLIGFLDSPFVRRVAISAQCLGVAYEHRELSIFRDYEAFREINPLVKVPTLVCDDGEVLVDSTLIIDYLETMCTHGKSLMPPPGAARLRALQIVGVALVAMEKTVSLIYERRHRPPEAQHGAWIERVEQQLCGALDRLESFVARGSGSDAPWLTGPEIGQADISLAVAWRFVQHVDVIEVDAAGYTGLAAFSARAEALPEFVACPVC